MTTENILLDLAKEFEKAHGITFLKTEEQLLINVVKGNTTDFSNHKAFLTRDKYKPDPDPTLMEVRTIRAALLRWLILDEKAKSNVSTYGIRIQSAFIEGVLNLDSARIPFPLIFQSCYIPDTIDLRDAQTLLLSFNGSHTGPIRASRIIVESSLALNEGFWAKGEIRLHGAHIKGPFDCRHGMFDNPVKPECASFEEKKFALMADDMKVDCDMYLTGAKSRGLVSLGGAQIYDDLKCEGAHFINRNEKALVADRMHVGGHVFFTVFKGNDKHKTRNFNAIGQVSFIQARISGSLFCRSARFFDRGQIVLDAREANIAGGIWFEGIQTNGLIRLTGSIIGSCLYFVHATFKGDCRTGLKGKALNVKGTFSWTSIPKSPTTQLDLSYAIVGQLQDEEGSWPEAGNLMLEGFVYDSLVTKLDPKRRINWLERQLTERLTGDDIEPKGFRNLAYKIIDPAPHDDVSKRLRSRLLREDLDKVDINIKKNSDPSKIDENVLLMGLNDLLLDKNLYKSCEEKWAGQKDIERLIAKKESLDPHGWATLNFKILKSVYPNLIKKDRQPLRRYFREQPYEQLASFLLALGMDTEAKEILIAKNDAKRKFTTLPWPERIFMATHKGVTDYGYKPLKAAKISICLIVFGGLVFMAGYEDGLMVPSKEYIYMNKPYRLEDSGTVKGELPSTYPEFAPFIYSLENFVPFLDLHQKAYWLPLSAGDTSQDAIKRREELKQRSPDSKPWYIRWEWLLSAIKCILDQIPETWRPIILHLWTWSEIILGWVLSTFFFAGMVGLMHEFHPHKKKE
jgi:hypothetical protein